MSLEKCLLFHGFVPSEKATLLEKYFETAQFNPGDSIFLKGESETHTLFVILSGEASVQLGPDDSITLKAGDVIGDIGFCDKLPRSAKVVATSYLNAAVFTDETFARLKRELPVHAHRIHENLTRILAAKIRKMNEVVQAMGLKQQLQATLATKPTKESAWSLLVRALNAPLGE